ncbi:TetR/AcrR family transcriptional regulator [Plastoroseomonas hellenica]|uniref:TetR/AcrR family transcriptional regulator n=1 Tax=Plastoroseomonas hellenica TaxID=2687306 RepID=A0ABS5ETK8_9PROT|nr:TetR/AcrR family transcriptional regulator [Plastoroseomonas hellenica]MBR0647440.1 TetR/AcrR family transcriptional regulator [Plastoroseomonas hellenica]MBR0663270.1 TetR/AcrR family transcriptional regulator [Plastoroseomonas hellenica]
MASDTATAAKPKAAQRIHDAAKDLFYRQGIRATGVEEVCRAAEATKMSLYRAYPSKDALVAAILTEDAAAYDAWCDEVTAASRTPAEKLYALVAASACKFAEEGMHGCPMQLAQAEFRDPEHPTHQVVVAFKNASRARFEKLAAEAGAADPAMLGDMLGMLLEGALAAVPYLGCERTSAVLREGAGVLLRGSLPAGTEL